MNFERFNKQLEFLAEIDKLKQILRNTIWIASILICENCFWKGVLHAN